jgi:hypothetical protein
VVCENRILQLAVGALADIETLAALRELGMPLSKAVVRAAALSGRLHILQHLLAELDCPRPRTISDAAAKSGIIDMLRWLKTEGFRFGRRACSAAAGGGHLAALQHLRSEACDWIVSTIAFDTASSGSIEVVEWLRRQQGIEIDARVLGLAVIGMTMPVHTQHRAATLIHCFGCTRMAALSISLRFAVVQRAAAMLMSLTASYSKSLC